MNQPQANKRVVVFLSLFALAAGAASSGEAQGDPSLAHLFPIPEQVKVILEQRCVFCHGEVIDGEPEIREKLDLSSEAKIRETLTDWDILHSQIESNEMPQEAKLSFRLRRNPAMQARLRELKSEYEANGERDILLAWLRRNGATGGQ